MTTYTSKDVLEFFYDLDDDDRRWGQWVLSNATVEALEERPSMKNYIAVTADGLYLVGRPIRIEESVKGLAFETPLRDR